MSYLHFLRLSLVDICLPVVKDRFVRRVMAMVVVLTAVEEIVYKRVRYAAG